MHFSTNTGVPTVTTATTLWSPHHGHHVMVTTPQSPPWSLHHGLPKNIVSDRHPLYQQALMKLLDIRAMGRCRIFRCPIAYVEYACVAEPFTLKPMFKPKSLTIFWSSTLGAIAAYGRNSVTTWPESSYDLARIQLRLGQNPVTKLARIQLRLGQNSVTTWPEFGYDLA